MTLTRKHVTFKCLSVKTHLICFFSSKLIGRSRMARIRSRVDRATSSLIRFCSSVAHTMTRQALAVIFTHGTIQNTDHGAHIHRNNRTPVTGSYHSPSRSWWHPLWKLVGQDQRWETCSPFSLEFPSISWSCFLDKQEVFAVQWLSQIFLWASYLNSQSY